MDEDNDVDIDSEFDDDDEFGDQQGASSNNMTEAERRAHHNKLERQRRDQIKESFSGLRDVIPTLNGERASRARILQSATDYIRDMGMRNSSIGKDIEELKRGNRLLEQQVRAAERDIPMPEDFQLVPQSQNSQFRSYAADVGLRSNDSSEEEEQQVRSQGRTTGSSNVSHASSGSNAAGRPRKKSRMNNS